MTSAIRDSHNNYIGAYCMIGGTALAKLETLGSLLFVSPFPLAAALRVHFISSITGELAYHLQVAEPSQPNDQVADLRSSAD